MSNLDVVVMAAGKGTRMKSRLPKVLHLLAGDALLSHVMAAVAPLKPRSVVLVTGHGAIEVEAHIRHLTRASSAFDLKFARQEPQLGTGHAVQQAASHLGDGGVTLILNGDVPLIRGDSLSALVAACAGNQLALLTLTVPDASGYGRILRDAAGAVQGIVEHKDATAAQREIREFYTGAMAAPTDRLKAWLKRLTNNNAQGEYYLTDVVAMAVADGVPVSSTSPASQSEVEGVNSPSQLAALERALQRSRAEALMEQGVRLADPARFDMRSDPRQATPGSLICGQDVSIDVNCIFEGAVSLADGVKIGANCVIANCSIGAGAVIHPFTHIDGEALGVQVGAGALVGPFARLRPGAQLGEEVHIGNFVEVKNSTLGKGAKANHLAYLGDATVGERVNYGAGSITANYDGANKHRTVIEADVHVGSNSVLVAPVTVGAGATVGAGSVVSKDAPAGVLAVARARQVNMKNWQRPEKIKK